MVLCSSQLQFGYKKKIDKFHTETETLSTYPGTLLTQISFKLWCDAKLALKQVVNMLQMVFLHGIKILSNIFS